jgi:hypothetical protein
MNLANVQSANPNTRSSLAGPGSTASRKAVVGIALGAADLLGVAITPDRAFPQQPMRREPPAGKDQRRPPCEADYQDRARDATNSHHHAVGKEVERDGERRTGHAAIEVARNDEIRGQRRIFEVGNPGRAHARDGELVVQPRRRPIAEVGADRLVEGREDLQQHEYQPGDCQRHRQAAALLHGANEQPHRHGERRREHAAQDQHRPPCRSERPIRARQHGEELPFVAGAQPVDHRDGG